MMISAEDYNSRFDFLIDPSTLANRHRPIHLLLSSSIRKSHTFRLYAEILKQYGCESSFLPFEVTANDEPRLQSLFNALRTNPNLETIMVSNPFKQRVYSYVDTITERARACGGINLITKTSAGIGGDNLDGIAFTKGLEEIDGINLQDRSMLFIGCGGVSSAVSTTLAPTLEKIGLIDIDVNKAEDLKKSLLQLNPAVEIIDPQQQASLTGYTVIYDGTGSGKLGQSPISTNHNINASLFIDAVYTPEVTPFLEQGLLRGAKIVNGLSHMFASTSLHCSIITGQTIALNQVHPIYIQLQKSS